MGRIAAYVVGFLVRGAPNTGKFDCYVPRVLLTRLVVAPDDLAFDSRGNLYITEVMSERVCARSPNGDLRIIADNVPAANGITQWHDRQLCCEFVQLRQ